MKHTGVTGVALSGETKVERKMIRCLEHHFKLRGSGSTSRRRRSSGRARTPSPHGGDSRSNSIIDLLWAVNRKSKKG